MQNNSQSCEFLYFCLIGIIISLIFDIFRTLRKNFKTPDVITYIEDILFVIISSFIIMLGILKIANGILRFYLFLGLFLGIITYSLTFSKFCIIIINGIVVFCKKMSLFVLTFFKYIVNLLNKFIQKLQFK